MQYTYLSLIVTASGSFSPAVNALKEKARRALYAIRRRFYNIDIPISIWCKVFDSVIQPIALYGSEVWGPLSQREMDSCVALILLSMISLTTADIIKLADGGSHCAGRVDVFFWGQWRTVCDDYWDIRGAAVVCRELGCGEAVDVLNDAHFGPGPGAMWEYPRVCNGSESTVNKCGARDFKARERICDNTHGAGMICSAGVRLVDGDSRCAGRVEVLHRGQWGTVCDDGWDMRDAAVVCRELRCGEAVDALSDAHFGPGSGTVWMVNVDCRGSESTLKNCKSPGWGKHNCDHSKDAGVICSGNLPEVRLVGGSRCSGRVEVLHGETWSTVCDADFDQQDAEVVCRELGCGLPVEVLGAAAFGRGEGQVWSEELQCRGNESQIYFCPTSSSLKHSCSHDNDVGLVCAGSVRLVDGGSRCAGRVEVLHRGQWGTVCDDGWDIRAAAVVCRELGCGEAVDALSDAHFGPGSGQIWMVDVDCSGSESTLKNCHSTLWGKHSCNHSNDAGVFCSGVRLVGGSRCSGRVEVLHGESWSTLVDGGSRCAGRVEVLHRRQWGTVCSHGWDIRDAAVVCRELRCGEAVDALSDGHFGPGSGPIWMDNVHCSGSESTLKNCSSLESSKHDCDHSTDAGVICSGVRLVGGSRCSGRVEVLHGETWSTVCDADFDQQDAEVVCRELGCGLPVEVRGAAAFGRGEGQVWSKELQCRGNESQIHFCPTSSSLKLSCSHDSDVALVCSGIVRLVDGGSRCAGRVEVFHRGQWGTVCAFIWHVINAAVVCRQLDCGEPLSVEIAAPGSGPIWMSHVDCSGSESTLKNCGSLGWGKHSCVHLIDIGIHCSGMFQSSHTGHRKSRLTGGPHQCSGRVEVLHGETWSTVCDANFDQQDAEVVCRELGCGLPVEVLGAAAFGRGEGQVWSEELQCRGNEFEITFCPISSSLRLNCTHDSDVGLICSGQTGAQLVNGSDSCSGRVELQYLSEWGTVCDVNWDMRAASVLCGQLKCGSAVAVLGSDWFGEGSGQIWAEVFDCQGNEKHLSKCPISSWSRTACSHKQDAGVICSGSSLAFNEGRVRLSGGMECEGEVNETSLWNCRFQLCGEDECGHMEDVGVVCSEYKEIRLTEGCEGNLEVFYNGTWGNVCVNDIDEETISLICQELNCGRSGSLSQTKARVESAPNWLDDLKCRKHDSTLWQCPSSSWGENNCDNLNEVARITCSEHLPLRLRGGNGSCSGRLEVYHNAEWGSVCDNEWDIREAQVVCRQLDCGPALSADGSAVFGAGEGPIWLNRVKCRGNEIHLWDCPHSLKNHTDCSHSQDAGVTCAAGQTENEAVTPPQTPSPAVSSIYAVSLLVLGVLLFLALVLLVVLFYQNRVLRRVLSKRKCKTLTEAVYEEIDQRLIAKRMTKKGK
ncbi:deleted in malignant brain tumors 1 protein-like [Colossoma macropomum]|uniref:deleted in malignant brain tumors 1 protein-like n=1 Tax=Colossoma macropomum TaxID=42526 RepID=UPI001864071D|nr:deleted in malignant brain tumors 1 protein-like [Colossoma macropomum]